MSSVDILREVVDKVLYKPMWFFDVVERDRGAELIITTHTRHSLEPESDIQVRHVFAVPPTAYDGHAWERWVLDQICLVETHEACEFFQSDGLRPFFPDHRPTRNPYVIERV